MSDERQPSPSDQIKRLYEDSESQTAKAFEQLVSTRSFGELLARMTENVVAVNKIATDTFDLVVRNLRIAGRQDIVTLARQLARTEDKLELLLQEVEALRDDLDSPGGNGRARARSPRARSESGSSS